MARAQWPLVDNRPSIQIQLRLAINGQTTARTLLADTGAGKINSPFELLLDEHDGILCGAKPAKNVRLGGAYSGSFPSYTLRVEIPQLNFDTVVFVVCIPTPPNHFEGIAGFRFLSRFTYGNFGNAKEFGLEG